MSRTCLLSLAALLGGLLSSVAHARVEGDAIAGKPFGVARVTFTSTDAGGPIDESQVLLYERDSRVHYPAVTGTGLGRALGQLLDGGGNQGAASVTVTFLFQGDTPLKINLYTPQRLEFTLPVTADDGKLHTRLLSGWWKDYSQQALRLEEAGDHPQLVQTYLTSMLAQRLRVDALPAEPAARPPREGRPERPLLGKLRTKVGDLLRDQPRDVRDPAVPRTQASLELLLGMERLRNEALRETMMARGNSGETIQFPIPKALNWPELPVPVLAKDIPVEPLALHVPQECFYVRFDKFSNYLWLNKLMEDYGGDISSMITLRGYIPPLNKRAREQLALEQNALAEIFGNQVIADVALIGRDTYVNEGAAIGMLFQARNDLFANDITAQRKRALQREKANGSAAETVKIAGHDVSFISTPDNRLRSFHAVDGKFHLVTTSRSMVERFYEAGEGKDSLGQSEEFRFARSQMPLKRDDTIFVYMSSKFFQGLLSPQYQTELSRRMKSVTDIEALTLARLAAHGENAPAETIEELIDGSFLPKGFGRRPDGSGPIIAGDRILDSRRGARGTFIPVPDVELKGLTESEQILHTELAQAYIHDWKQLDPLMISLRRFALDKPGQERLVIDGTIAPFDESKYGTFASILGPPTTEMITPAPGDVINLQASVRGGLLFPSVQPSTMFLGVQDMVPLSDLPPKGLLQTLQLIRSTPGYLGGWPKPGFLDALPLGLGGTPDEYGFSKMLFGLWRRQGNGFSVLSFDPQLLADVTPNLRPVEAAEPAQVRLHVSDLSQSKFAAWINATWFQRAVETVAGNNRLLHSLNQQLHVPLEECRGVAEDLLDARLRCTLGGDYAVTELPGGGKYWQSTAAPKSGEWMPENYTAPLLEWFRGVDASLIKLDDKVLAHVELDMQRKPAAAGELPKFEIPSIDVFNLFGGGQKALQPKEKKDDPKKPAAEELPPPLPPVPRDARPKTREF
ncbi:MAG: hypothetical protein IAF94_03755 [Pirellulaceae bacterium]|nr:hypothetical protein [Pirellulaceae bacterium]